MNAKGNSRYAGDWRAIAAKDLDRVRRNLREGDVEAAAFFLQQALEKYLKAFLLDQDWRLQKVHTLTTLLDFAVEHVPELESFRGLCERVTGYYFTERYPQLLPLGLTAQDIERDLAETDSFISLLTR